MEGKILLISWSLPPELTGSATVVGNLASQFSEHEMVIACERRFPYAATVRNRFKQQVFFIAPQRFRSIRGQRTLEKMFLPLDFPLILLRLWRIVRQHECSSLLVIFPNEKYLLAGYLIARWTGCALFPYFHNTYVENRRGISKVFAKWLQPRVFRHASHVFVMSEGMEELFREHYPFLENCSALVHSFKEDIPVLKPHRQVGSPLQLIFQGNINESCLDALRRMRSALRSAGNSQLTLVTGIPGCLLERWGLLGDGVRHLPAITDRAILLQYLGEADIVLLPHGFTGSLSEEEYRTIFPTKTLEYLICGRPILAHSPSGSFLTRFLKRHDCALVVEEPSEDALCEAFKRLELEVELRNRLVRNALKTARMFQASRVAEEMRSIIRRAASKC